QSGRDTVRRPQPQLRDDRGADPARKSPPTQSPEVLIWGVLVGAVCVMLLVYGLAKMLGGSNPSRVARRPASTSQADAPNPAPEPPPPPQGNGTPQKAPDAEPLLQPRATRPPPRADGLPPGPDGSPPTADAPGVHIDRPGIAPGKAAPRGQLE